MSERMETVEGCPNCGAFGREAMVAAKRGEPVVTRGIKYDCGSWSNDEALWTSEMCYYAARLRRERDAMRAVVDAVAYAQAEGYVLPIRVQVAYAEYRAAQKEDS